MGLMVSFKLPVLVLSLLAIQSGRVRAQTASCKSGWEWMNNTAGLNPCQIAASLDSWCLGLDLTVEPIPPGIIYLPPDDGDSQFAICDCNTPMYSLYSACAACQGTGWVKWSEWSAVCHTALVGVRPEPFLITTPMPHWMFMNVTVNDTFVPEAAEAVGGLPEQRADGPTTTFSPTRSSTLLHASNTLSPSSSSSSSSSDLPSATNTVVAKSKPPVGAIVSGVIGGLVVLCLAGLGFFFLRKRRGLRTPKIRKASGTMSLFDPQEGGHDPRMEEAAAVQRPLLYDPSDPSTFSQVHAELEKPLHSGSVTQGSMGYYDSYHTPQQPSTSSGDHRYTGIPEVH